MRIVHLPFYDDNPYQSLLMEAECGLGHEVWEGGGGGNFLGRGLPEWKADVLHFHWLHPYLLRKWAAASVARAIRFLGEVAILKLLGARIVWTIHNLVNHKGRHPGIEQVFSSAFAKMADACFAHSRAAADAAAVRFGILASKLHVIPHGSYIGAYPNRIGRKESREHLGLPEEAKVFLFLDRIEAYKGVIDLIESFEDMPASCHLVIAGKVSKSGLKQLLDERCAGNPRVCCHLERIPDDELQVFFNAADVVVFPFKQILTSGSIVLAMSFGKAVVAPMVASLTEILPDTGVTWFDPEGGSRALTKAMDSWLSCDCHIAGESNRQSAQAWDWDAIAERIIEQAKENGR